MQVETAAVIITKDKETMDKVKELLKTKAKTAYGNISPFSTDTRIDIDEGFIVNPSEDDFYDQLYALLDKNGVCFFASSDSSVDPYTDITFYIDGEVHGITAEGIESTYIGDIADWLDKWKLKITERMAEILISLGVEGNFIIGDPATNEDTYSEEDEDDEDEYEDGLDAYVAELNERFNDGVLLVGTQYEGRNERIEHVKEGDAVVLIREEDNPYDRNAIDVQNDEGSLGHLDAESAAILSNLIDEELVEYKAVIKSVMPLSQRSKRAKNAVISIQIELKSLES